MRTWVEKLAKQIEKKGIFIGINSIRIGNIEVCCIEYLTPFTDTYYNISISDTTNMERANYKLYEDELDVIQEAFKVCENRSKKRFIEMFESYTDDVTNEPENDID